MTPQTLPVDELTGYRSYYNTLDAEEAARYTCPICGTATEYRGFRNVHLNSYRAFAVCPSCGHTIEF